MLKFNAAVAALLPLCALVSAVPADARIVCQGDNQLVQGNLIYTPYCADNYLALVARERGFKVSDTVIRNNPNTKREICRYIGSDIRVSQNCNTVNPSGRRGY